MYILYYKSNLISRQFKSVDYRKLSLLEHFSHLFVNGCTESSKQDRVIERPISCLVPRIVYWKDVAIHVMHSKVWLIGLC